MIGSLRSSFGRMGTAKENACRCCFDSVRIFTLGFTGFTCRASDDGMTSGDVVDVVVGDEEILLIEHNDAMIGLIVTLDNITFNYV